MSATHPDLIIGEVSAASPGLQKLLDSAGLVTSDLTVKNQVFFGVTGSEGEIIASVGLSIKGDAGLVRSLAISPRRQGEGMGRHLLSFIEECAVNHGLRELWLLTDTARDFFLRAGYKEMGRRAAPEPVRQSAQFRSLCPDSAVLMAKPMSLRTE